MATKLFFCCVAMFFVGPVAGYHCRQNCDSEGLLPEEVPTFIPVEQVSQCAEPDSELLREALHCDDSTPGTGHLLYRELTEDVVAVERCYSFCFGNSTPREGRKPNSGDLNSSGKKCFQVDNPFICFSACLFMRGLDGLKTAPSLFSLSANATCKDFCTPPDGICDRAFSPSADEMCGMNCKASLCADMCDKLDQHFQAQSNPQAQSISSPSGKLSLQLASSYELRKQGVLEVSSTDNNGSTATYGLVWKVIVNDSLEYYIPQHLPFHFLQTEVGPLYRVGFNMLSIRQLQCLPGVNLSYALVNAVGVSEFSEPQEQCFYGNGFPQPPTDLHASIGFIPFSPKLRLTLGAGILSPDHANVTVYEVAVYRENSEPLVKLVFPDKENLSLNFEDEEVFNVFPSFSKPYYLSFYALPQKNTTANNRTIRPAGNWLMMTPKIPDYPILNGTSCYSLTQDRSEGKVNATIRLSLHSGWKSLAPVASIKGMLTLRGPVTLPTPFPGFLPMVVNGSLKHYQETQAIENVTQVEYTYKYDNLDPTSGKEFYEFTITLDPRFADHELVNPALEISTDFTAQALPPLPVTDLQVCYTVDSGSQALLNISWLPPGGRRVDLTYQVNSSRDGAIPNTIAVTPPDPLFVNLTVPLPGNSVLITVVALSSGVAGTPSTVTLNLADIASNTCLKAEGTSVTDNDIISVVSTCPTEIPHEPNSARRCTLSAAAILCAVILVQVLAVV